MGLFSRKKDKAFNVAAYSSMQSLMQSIRRNKSSVNLLTGDNAEFCTNAYDLCPPLSSVIRKKAEMLTNGRLISVKPDLTPSESPAFNKAMKTLSAPNALMKKDDFLMYIETCLNVYGVAYVFEAKSVGFTTPTALIPIPNEAISIIYKNSVNIADSVQLSDYIESYTITIMNMPLILKGDDKKQIHEIRSSSVNLKKGFEFKPHSRVLELRKPIQNIVGSLESRNQIIVKRGAEGILSPKQNSDPTGTLMNLDPETKKKIQDDYNKYGYLDGQWKTIITDMPFDYQAITRKVQDLGLFQGEDSDKRTIFTAFNIPTPLMGLPDEAKYNTYEEAERKAYENAIMPDSRLIAACFDEIFKADGWQFYFDYSSLSCFQKSEEAKATALDKTITALKNGVDAGFVDIADAKRIVSDFIK